MGISWPEDNGLYFFPVTPFTGDGEVNIDALRHHVESRLDYAPAAVFVACGTGEFNALGLDEYEAVVANAVEVVAGRMPVVAGAGYSGALCREFLARAEEGGADAALVFPPGAAPADQAGVVSHYRAVAASTSLSVILYQRDQMELTSDSARVLSEVPNIVGLKDGRGNLDNLQQIKIAASPRWTYFNGMPTAELSVAAFRGLGISNYSSAFFAVLPEIAVAFYRSVTSGDDETRDRLLREVYLPFAALRDRKPGYAVSLIKAGMRIRGIDVGSVRPPLVDPTEADQADLEKLITTALNAV